MNLEQHQLIELHETLASRFDESELRTLCFNLQVDYDDLPGAGKTDKARELVGHFERRNQLSKLVAAILAYRPDINLSVTQPLAPDFISKKSRSLLRLKEIFWDQRSNTLKGVTIASVVTFILALIGLAADLAGLGFPIHTFPTPTSELIPTETRLPPEGNSSISIGGDVVDNTIIQSGGGDVTINQSSPSATPEPSPTSISPFIQALLEGYELLMENQLGRADEKFIEARNIYPTSPDPSYWRARVAIAQNNYEGAIGYLDQAILLDPKHYHSLALKIGSMLFISGDELNAASELATQSYGIISEDLDSWIDCLKQQESFSKGITPSEMALFCPFPAYKWEEVRSPPE